MNLPGDYYSLNQHQLTCFADVWVNRPEPLRHEREGLIAIHSDDFEPALGTFARILLSKSTLLYLCIFLIMVRCRLFPLAQKPSLREP
jgi:hypothetical protein